MKGNAHLAEKRQALEAWGGCVVNLLARDQVRAVKTETQLGTIP